MRIPNPNLSPGLGACRALAFESRVRACFEIKALSSQEGWLPFKDLATQRSEQGRMRGDVKTMCDRLLVTKRRNLVEIAG